MATATRRKRSSGARVSVSSLKLNPEDDWFTPNVLHLSPLEVQANVGKKGRGTVQCSMQEGQYERQSVTLKIEVEAGRVPGLRFVPGWTGSTRNGVVGSFTLECVNQMIEALTAARDKAQEIGLFTPRPTPSNLEDVLAATRRSA